ncbi:MAG: adenylosuccinate synthetase [Blastochloris sp.]|nr:adenylosuccinate synthetase [Blastochloris sp.]
MGLALDELKLADYFAGLHRETIEAGRLDAAAAQALLPHVRNTIGYLHGAIAAGKEMLFEGAQGTFLDIDFGTYPYVTSSATTSGLGVLRLRHVHHLGGVVARQLGFQGARLAATMFAADVAVGTAWDVSVHGNTFGDALGSNLVWGVVPEVAGSAAGYFTRPLIDAVSPLVNRTFRG